MRGGKVAFASAVRNASQGVRSARYPAARASACSAPTTSPNSGAESLVVRRKQRAASSAGQLASSINEALRVLSAGPPGQAWIRVASMGRMDLVRARAPAIRQGPSGL